MFLASHNFISGYPRFFFGDGSYSGNIIQGGSVLQPQASYTYTSPTKHTLTAGMISHVGFSSFNAALMIDGIQTAHGGYVPNGATAGSARLKLDLGSPVALVKWRQSCNNQVCTGSWKVQYSDDGTTWFDAGSNVANLLWGAWQTFSWSHCGEHRYWSMVNTDTSNYQGWWDELEVFAGALLQNAIVVTGAATVAPDGTTGASVVQCDTLVVDGGTLAPSTNSKGLIVLAKSGIHIVNGGKAHIDKLGKAGNYGNLTVLDLVPQSIKRKLKPTLAAYVALGEGALGGAQCVLNGSAYGGGFNGPAASSMQTGGGGSGNGNGVTPSIPMNNPGGNGGPCCGGAGSGSQYGVAGTGAGPYGGPGGNANNVSYTSAGPGDPPGTGGAVNPSAPAAGGGLLMLFAPSISIASGCIVSADGAPGVGGGGGTYPTCSGGAGGGCVVAVTNAEGYSNAGTVRANGGVGPQNSWGASYKAGDGGAGSVNTFTVS